MAKSRQGTNETYHRLFFKFISFIAEAFIFVFLGFSSWNYFGNEKHDYSWSWTFVILQLAVCTIARFVSVFVLSGIVYFAFMRKTWKVNIYELGIIWFAGVIRGSVAFALILTLDEEAADDNMRR
jgi:NhaP-type Na+/H+ or K+/H+ antiporter